MPVHLALRMVCRSCVSLAVEGPNESQFAEDGIRYCGLMRLLVATMHQAMRPSTPKISQVPRVFVLI